MNVGGWCRLAGMEVLVTLHDENMMRMMIINDDDIGCDNDVFIALPELSMRIVLPKFCVFCQNRKVCFFCRATK